MIKRYALFFGSLKPGKVEEFKERITWEAAPLWRAIPKLLDLDYRIPVDWDEAAPELSLIVTLSFASHEDMIEGLRSPQRQQVKAVTASIIEDCFEGTPFHYIT